MWTVVYMNKDEEHLTSIKEKLKEKEIMVMVRKVDDFFELLVPATEVADAHNIIIESEI